MLGYIRFILKHYINISHLLLLYTHILLTRYQLTLSPIWKTVPRNIWASVLKLAHIGYRNHPFKEENGLLFVKTLQRMLCAKNDWYWLNNICKVNVINVLTIISLCNRREHLRSVYTGHWVYLPCTKFVSKPCSSGDF